MRRPTKMISKRSAYAKSGPDIDLLMIGKTGNGKSALGNSLLQQSAFESRPSSASVTKEVEYEVTEFNGRRIKVVDGPGVGDTDCADDKRDEFVADALANAIAMNPTGYHAFLLVVKFGGRFTKEDIQTVAFLKKIFGGKFVQRFCILVMTCGDQFEDQVDVPFQEWLKSEKGVLVDLVHECDNRIILFDNRTKIQEKKQKQLIDLIDMVDSLILENSKYTNEQFELARSERDAFIVTSQKDFIIEEAMSEANIILQLFMRAQDQVKNDNDTTWLEEIWSRANELHEKVFKKDNKTCVLNELLSHINSIRSSIGDEIKLCRRMTEYKAKLKLESEEKIFQLNVEMNNKIGMVMDESRRLEEFKDAKMESDMARIKESELQLSEEKQRLEVEFQKIKEMAGQIEEHHKNLKKKMDRGIFTSIKHKVAKTFHNKSKDKKVDGASAPQT